MANEPRPNFNSPGIKEAAARETALDLVKDGHLEESELDDAIAAIARHAGRFADGYEIAKRLEDSCYWDCNFQMAEVLDGHHWNVTSVIEKAEKEWAERTQPQPPLPIGTRVSLTRNETGVITGIYDRGAAKYLVKVDGDPAAEEPTSSRRIINFEDAILHDEAVSA
jgi:hypothetical protein